MKKSQLRNIIRETIAEEKGREEKCVDIKLNKEVKSSVNTHLFKPCGNNNVGIYTSMDACSDYWINCWPGFYSGTFNQALTAAANDFYNLMGSPSLGQVVKFTHTACFGITTRCYEYMGQGPSGMNYMLHWVAPILTASNCTECSSGRSGGRDDCDPSNFTNAFPPSFGTGAGFPGLGIGGCRSCGLLSFQGGLFTGAIGTSVPQSTPSPNPNFATLGDVCIELDNNDCCINY